MVVGNYTIPLGKRMDFLVRPQIFMVYCLYIRLRRVYPCLQSPF